MRCFALVLAPLFLVAAPVVHAGGKEEKPAALVVQVRSLERVLDQTKLILSLIGREDIADQVERALKVKVGPDGIEGVDLKKPLGLVLRFGKEIEDITPLFLLPISDEKAFLKVLENNKLKITKGKDDIYTARIGGGLIEVEVYFRFARGYLFATVLSQTGVENAHLPADPVKALGGTEGPTFSLTLRLDQVPLAARQLAAAEFEKFAGPLMKKAEAPELAKAALESISHGVQLVLTEGEEVKLTVDLEKKSKKLQARFSLTAKAGSELAKGIEGIAENKSQFAGLFSDKSLFAANLNLKLPEKMQKAFVAFVAEMKEKAISELVDKDKQRQAKALFAVLEPTFQDGRFDFFARADLGKEKTLDYVFGLQVKDGKKLEKALRELVEDILKTAPKKEMIKLDFAKVGDVSIHRLDIPETRELAPIKTILGEAVAYFAFRDEAVFVSLGAGGKERIEEALGAAKPGKAPFLFYRADMRGIFQLMSSKGIEVHGVEKLFPPGGDNVVLLRAEGGSALTVHVDLPLNIFLLGRMEK